ncbi:hypothetical protein FRC14_003344 [Serendipita sp. 396]|nr:hypothetical protein FRC14_003344 [Serendipita sp. 396]KAG8803510.1 hypothetical protein FRC16_004918 [Serendipita sp. 398]
MISQFVGRQLPDDWLNDDCVFCKIIKRDLPAHIIYENDLVVAFLDTLPIRPGHTLVIPKAHCPRLTDLKPELGAALGQAMITVGNAITQGLENPNLNVVCNQGYAQAVHHVHIHLVPSPVFGKENEPPEQETQSDTVPTVANIMSLERALRDDLDHDEAVSIADRIRSKL